MSSELVQKPIWRSAAFWLGTFVASFLLWCWWDSMAHITLMSRASASKTYGLESKRGGVHLARLDRSLADREMVGVSPQNWDWERRSMAAKGLSMYELNLDWFPKLYWRHNMYRTGIRHVWVVVPYWLLLTGWLFVWVCGTFGRRRWQRKRLAAGASPEAGEDAHPAPGAEAS